MKSRKFVWLISVVAVLLIIVGAVSMFMLNSNKQLFDFNQKFEYAYICWPDGTAERVKLVSWKDYDGEQIQITIDKGTYVFHSTNCVLAHE